MNEVLQSFMLDGKVALVTGASSGFGHHMAKVLAKVGARVVVGARRRDRLEALCEEIRQDGGEALALDLDVTDSASVRAAFDGAEEAFGTVTVVVNNAGITIPKLLLDLTDEDWLNVVDTNLNGVMLCDPGSRSSYGGC